MFKDSSAKFYKNNNKKLQKSLMKNIKIYLKKKKKNDNIGVNDGNAY